MFTINVLAWVLLAGSVSAVVKTSYKNVDPSLQDFVSGYYELVNKDCSDPAKYNSSSFYSIQFITLDKDDSTIAYCQIKNLGYDIRVNRNYWNEMNVADQRQLMYHELAHCVVYRDHVNDESNYMNPYFYAIPYSKYIKQVVADIKEQCPK